MNLPEAMAQATETILDAMTETPQTGGGPIPAGYPLPPLIDISNPAIRQLRVAAAMAAHRSGAFWLPCPLCGTEFSGLEWMTSNELHTAGGPVAHIPSADDPGPGSASRRYTGICPFCTQAGRGHD